MKKGVKKLEQELLPRLQKYEDQERILNRRNSYSKTDPDASSLQCADGGTEAQFVVGYNVHQQADDTSFFITCLLTMF